MKLQSPVKIAYVYGALMEGKAAPDISHRHVKQWCGEKLCVRPDHLYLAGDKFTVANIEAMREIASIIDILRSK